MSKLRCKLADGKPIVEARLIYPYLSELHTPWNKAIISTASPNTIFFENDSKVFIGRGALQIIQVPPRTVRLRGSAGAIFESQMYNLSIEVRGLTSKPSESVARTATIRRDLEITSPHGFQGIAFGNLRTRIIGLDFLRSISKFSIEQRGQGEFLLDS